nr:hypothetical protein [Tanacetum cinerariifolium]
MLTKTTMLHGLLVFFGDPDHEVPVAKTFHEQTDEEFTEKEVMQMEADDQAIQTILMGIANSNVNQNGNGNVEAARAEGDLEEIKEVNANCILMSNLQQASTSGTQTDKAPVYDSDGSVEEIANLNNQLSNEKSDVSCLQQEKKKLKSDFKTREDELLD